MQHLDFIVWMIMAPVAEAVVEAIQARWGERREYPADVRGMAALLTGLFYLGIGWALW